EDLSDAVVRGRNLSVKVKQDRDRAEAGLQQDEADGDQRQAEIPRILMPLAPAQNKYTAGDDDHGEGDDAVEVLERRLFGPDAGDDLTVAERPIRSASHARIR